MKSEPANLKAKVYILAAVTPYFLQLNTGTATAQPVEAQTPPENDQQDLEMPQQTEVTATVSTPEGVDQGLQPQLSSSSAHPPEMAQAARSSANSSTEATSPPPATALALAHTIPPETEHTAADGLLSSSTMPSVPPTTAAPSEPEQSAAAPVLSVVQPPQTTSPQTAVQAVAQPPQITLPQTTSPQATFSRTTLPQTTPPQATFSRTTLPQATPPQATFSQTTPPQTTPLASNPLVQPSPVPDQPPPDPTPQPNASAKSSVSEPAIAEPGAVESSTLAPDAVAAPTEPNPSDISEIAVTPLTVIPVGINLGNRTVVAGALVRGAENGREAIDFDNWLIPFDVVVSALNITVTPKPEGQWELRSPSFAVFLSPDDLSRDPELGQVISIGDIRRRFGIAAKFDLRSYAIQFEEPGTTGGQRYVAPENQPVVTDGLPYVGAPEANVTVVSQGLVLSGNSSSSSRTQGGFTALGSLGNGSWFTRIDQSNLLDTSTWSVGEAQYLIESDAADYAIGSQPSFWRGEEAGDLWGFTTIQRWGYEPYQAAGGGGFNANARLGADAVPRNIVGEAAPGTLAQLVLGSRRNVVAEVLVDGSGLYRFDNIPAGGAYQVLLFPGGQLSAIPEVREASSLSTLPSRLPAGASALVASAGMRRTSRNSFWGEFSSLNVGAGYRYGVSDELTVGAGLIYDNGVLGLGEIFFQPDNVPLQVAVSALVGGRQGLDVNANLAYQPTPDLRLSLNSDRFSSRVAANWRATQNLSLRATGDSALGAFGLGATGSFRSGEFYGTASADYYLNGRYRWSGTARYDRFALNTNGTEKGTNSELSVRLSDQAFRAPEHSLLLGHSTRSSGSSLTTLGYRFRSGEQASDGRYLWGVNAGYGFSDQGSGPTLGVSTAAIPGVILRAQYNGGGALSNDSSFRVEIQPFVNTQVGTLSDNSRFDHLRRRGGLWFQPFLDLNGNNQLDSNEEILTEDVELLVQINNQNLSRYRPEVQNAGVLAEVFPGVYRVDLNPAGFPLDWRPAQTSYAVEVIQGQYTPVLIPFVQSYTVAGRVLTAEGNGVGGAIVEAISAQTGLAITSVTNSAGVYYLENLTQGSYELRVNGLSVRTNPLVINQDTEVFQEINLQVP
ncbi:carboxypeptidase regulatory-like domain-containing protein [Nodosilinea sp. E11]|uniref:carboxypeptidase regulatory-like domain-containing protein n=1 Tax=Nodosilinea sp. E11 TaxID=3037479 RepID=UPI0029350E47|nr:carboxypeptidase regulatory-like domain-containing protein [Nodosilinea sp. E11]WOD39828.1 carboxypeptidase regulatory-like domain-containing protein [Nodosilinea sp. E11]